MYIGLGLGSGNSTKQCREQYNVSKKNLIQSNQLHRRHTHIHYKMCASIMLRRGFRNPSVILGNPSRYYRRLRLEFCLCQQQVELVGLRLAQEPWSSGVSVRHHGFMSGYRTLTTTRKMLTSTLSSSWTERDFNWLADATLDAIHAEVERGLEVCYVVVKCRVAVRSSSEALR